MKATSARRGAEDGGLRQTSGRSVLARGRKKPLKITPHNSAKEVLYCGAPRRLGGHPDVSIRKPETDLTLHHSSRRRMRIALCYGALCHTCFALGVTTMVVMMFFGMRQTLGALKAPWSWIANAALLAQFVIMHSFLLTHRGQAVLARLAPSGTGTTSRRLRTSPSRPYRPLPSLRCGRPAARFGGRRRA